MTFLFRSSKPIPGPQPILEPQTELDLKPPVYIDTKQVVETKPVTEITPIISAGDQQWVMSHKLYYMACLVFNKTGENLYFDYIKREANASYQMTEEAFQKYSEVHDANMSEVSVKLLKDTIVTAHKNHQKRLLIGYFHKLNTMPGSTRNYICKKDCVWHFGENTMPVFGR